MVPDQSQMEINMIDRCLDILATAELCWTFDMAVLRGRIHELH